MIPIIVIKGVGKIVISNSKIMDNLNDVQVFNCKKKLKSCMKFKISAETDKSFVVDCGRPGTAIDIFSPGIFLTSLGATGGETSPRWLSFFS